MAGRGDLVVVAAGMDPKCGRAEQPADIKQVCKYCADGALDPKPSARWVAKALCDPCPSFGDASVMTWKTKPKS